MAKSQQTYTSILGFQKSNDTHDIFTSSRDHARGTEFGVLVGHLVLVDLAQSSSDGLSLVQLSKDGRHVGFSLLGSR